MSSHAWPRPGYLHEPVRPRPHPAPRPRTHRARSATWATPAVRLVTVTALLVAGALAALMIVPTVLGFDRFVIISGSMEPDIPTGSLVYSEAVPVGDLRVGDVITVVPPAEYGISTPVTHRIIEIGRLDGEPTFRTRGDANASPDPWTITLDQPSQARVVATLPLVGYAFIGLQDPGTRAGAIGLPALGIAVSVLTGLWRASTEAVLDERRASRRDA